MDDFDKVCWNILLIIFSVSGIAIWSHLDIKILSSGLLMFSIAYYIHNNLYTYIDDKELK